MYPHLAYTFVDGGYVRMVARESTKMLPNPLVLGNGLVKSGQVQTWAYNRSVAENAFLGRITYYDAMPEEATTRNADVEEYWKAIELLDDVHLGFGALRGLKKRMRQKGVDTLIAVDMLVGAFSALFDIAILVAGDADFVPVVEEVKRRGVMVAVAGSAASVADDLRRAADRYIELHPSWLAPMQVNGRTIQA